MIDKWLSSIPNNKLNVSFNLEHVKKLQELYSESTIKRIWGSVNASVNLAVKTGLIITNPYSGYLTLLDKSRKGERSCKPFEDYEVIAILEAFKTDRFNHKCSSHKHSYYYPFVRFLALTGCRPEDAIALTIKDIITQNGREVIRFSKAYTHKELKETKTGTIRIFPVNRELKECLESAPTDNNQRGLNLIFPSQEGGYIDLHNFTSRYFNVVVKNLYLNGEIKNQLPTYHLRHTFITQMIRKGIDIATIANLVGNSPETILSNYLGSNQGIELPELFNDD